MKECRHCGDMTSDPVVICPTDGSETQYYCPYCFRQNCDQGEGKTLKDDADYARADAAVKAMFWGAVVLAASLLAMSLWSR